jgi:hypothetical protein
MGGTPTLSTTTLNDGTQSRPPPVTPRSPPASQSVLNHVPASQSVLNHAPASQSVLNHAPANSSRPFPRVLVVASDGNGCSPGPSPRVLKVVSKLDETSKSAVRLFASRSPNNVHDADSHRRPEPAMPKHYHVTALEDGRGHKPLKAVQASAAPPPSPQSPLNSTSVSVGVYSSASAYPNIRVEDLEHKKDETVAPSTSKTRSCLETCFFPMHLECWIVSKTCLTTCTLY